MIIIRKINNNNNNNNNNNKRDIGLYLFRKNKGCITE